MAKTDQRHEISVLIGPCSSDDAEWLMERIAHYLFDNDQLGHPLGAAMSMSGWSDEPRESFAGFPKEPNRARACLRYLAVETMESGLEIGELVEEIRSEVACSDAVVRAGGEKAEEAGEA